MSEILITSSVLILAVLAVRAAFRGRISARLRYALWGAVLLRLMIPVTLPAADFSVLTAAKPVEKTVTEYVQRPVNARRETASPANTAVTRPVYVPTPRVNDAVTGLEPAPEATTAPAVGDVLRYIWYGGMTVMASWLIASNLSFYLRLRRTRERYDTDRTRFPVYISDAIISPCLFMGAIYLTPASVADPRRETHILAHEETHARHLDPVWALLRSAALVIYWFDPLVWLAAHLSRGDCELACDEGAIKRLGESERIAYGETLLSLIPISKLPASPLLSATTMSSDKRRLIERVSLIAKKRRTVAVAVILVLALILTACAITFTGAKESTEASGSSGSVPVVTLRSLSLYGPEYAMDNWYKLTLWSDCRVTAGYEGLYEEELTVSEKARDDVIEALKAHDLAGKGDLSTISEDGGLVYVDLYDGDGLLTESVGGKNPLDGDFSAVVSTINALLPRETGSRIRSEAEKKYAAPVEGSSPAAVNASGMELWLTVPIDTLEQYHSFYPDSARMADYEAIDLDGDGNSDYYLDGISPDIVINRGGVYYQVDLLQAIQEKYDYTVIIRGITESADESCLRVTYTIGRVYFYRDIYYDGENLLFYLIPDLPDGELTPLDISYYEYGEYVVITAGGIEYPIPKEYYPLLTVNIDEITGAISISETASYENGQKDHPGVDYGDGWLITLEPTDELGMERTLPNDWGGAWVAAVTRDGGYLLKYNATDVRFYPEGGVAMGSEDPAVQQWMELSEWAEGLTQEVIDRNGFTPFDGYGREYWYEGEHREFKISGDTSAVVSQPVRKGEGGIWAVEQIVFYYTDGSRSPRLVFPSSYGIEEASSDYYARLQEECDAGLHPEYLTPETAAGLKEIKETWGFAGN